MDKIAVTCIHRYVYIISIYKTWYYSVAEYQPLLNDHKLNNNIHASFKNIDLLLYFQMLNIEYLEIIIYQFHVVHK